MKFHHLRQVCLLLVASLGLTLAESQPLQSLNTNINEIDDKLPEKPEPRQIGAMMPYTWLQPGQALPPAPVVSPASSSWGSSSPSWLTSSGQSLMSLLKPSMTGGRRSSLTSRLRNLMNALFYRRETTSPYLTSGSSYSYAFRPPPFGFGTGFPSTGLTSAIGGQNLYGSASSYRPVVLPNYGSAPADAWSNYKQYGSNGQTSIPSSYSSSQYASPSASNWNSGSSAAASQPSAVWQSGSQSGSGSQYTGLGSSSYPSYSSGSSSSNNAYQGSSSNYPNNSYQRSSVSSYSKPQQNSSVSSSVSSSSSSSSSQNSKSVGYQSK